MPEHVDPCGPPWLQPNWRAKWRMAFTALLLFVSYKAFSTPSGAATIEHMDKLLHVSAFVGLACVASWCWAPGRRATWGVTLGLAVYGAFIELVQSQLPSREASLADWLVDALGIALGLALAFGVRATALKPKN